MVVTVTLVRRWLWCHGQPLKKEAIVVAIIVKMSHD
jgi:hypothetical protein